MVIQILQTHKQISLGGNIILWFIYWKCFKTLLLLHDIKKKNYYYLLTNTIFNCWSFYAFHSSHHHFIRELYIRRLVRKNTLPHFINVHISWQWCLSSYTSRPLLDFIVYHLIVNINTRRNERLIFYVIIIRLWWLISKHM